jgi:GDP-L-fucose synthase
MISQNIIESFNQKTVMVTGGTGLIGRQIVRILCDAGAHVKSVSLDDFNVDDRSEHIIADLCDFNICKEITGGVDYVFHVAGIKGSVEVTRSHPASFFVPMLMMNTNMLEASRINGVKKLVYTSSIGAYSSAEVFRENENGDGAPMDLYPGWAKRMAELQIKAYKKQFGMKNFAVVRPCNVYGPGDNFDPENAMVIPSLMCRILRKEDPVVVWGDGSAVRDFAYSRDVAEGVILALHYGTDNESGFVNLGSGKGVSISELVDTLHEFLAFNHRFDSERTSGFSQRVMDISLARKQIKYDPQTTLREGLEETWAWFEDHQDEFAKKKNYFKE